MKKLAIMLAMIIAVCAFGTAFAAAIDPINFVDLNELTGEIDVAIEPDGIRDTEITLQVYQADYYDVDPESIAVGDVITVAGEEMTIETVEIDENSSVLINGGLDNGGITLINESGALRVSNYDDEYSYTYVGDATLPIAEKVTIYHYDVDDEGNPTDQFVDTAIDGADLPITLAEITGDFEVPLNVLRTSAIVDEGKIAGIVIYYVP